MRNIKKFDDYKDMKKCFCDYENLRHDFHLKNVLKGLIVFTPNSFNKPYMAKSRCYIVTSDNKAYMPHMGGYSIYGTSLDGTDVDVRLETYMAEERGGKDGWKVSACYLLEGDFSTCDEMFSYLCKEKEFLEREFPVGTRIIAHHLVDEPSFPSGTLGEVVGCDDEPALLMNWQNGSSLKLYPAEDSYEIDSYENKK